MARCDPFVRAVVRVCPTLRTGRQYPRMLSLTARQIVPFPVFHPPFATRPVLPGHRVLRNPSHQSMSAKAVARPVFGARIAPVAEVRLGDAADGIGLGQQQNHAIRRAVQLTHRISIPTPPPSATIWPSPAGCNSDAVQPFYWTFNRSPRLCLPIGFHACWNFAISGLFGTTMSGRTSSYSVLQMDVSGPSPLTGGGGGWHRGVRYRSLSNGPDGAKCAVSIPA